MNRRRPSMFAVVAVRLDRPRPLFLFVSLGLATLTGCLKKPEPSVPPVPQARVDDLFDVSNGELVEEQWEGHYVRGAKLGRRHRQTFRLEFPGANEPELRQLVATDYLELRRFGTVIRQELMSVSVESIDGTVKQLGYRVKSGESQSTAVAEVLDGVLRGERADGVERTEFNLAWDPSQGGIFAIEKSLAARPMSPGESRVVQAFVPLVDRVVTYDLVAKQTESTTLGDETRELLRIEATDRGGNDSWKIPTVHWIDVAGTIVKTQEAFLNRVTRVVNEQEALSANETYRIDLGIDTGVAISSPIAQPDNTNYAVYRVRVDGLDPTQLFPNSAGQRVLAAEPGVALVTVQRVLPNQPATLDVDVTPPSDDDLTENRLIQSNHPRVKALASAVVSDDAKADAWRTAASLQRYLHATLRKNDFSQVFSSAGEVAERKEGDCSEHAVLLAAACRSCGIPSRVALGMIYSPEEQSFLYHMWNEVWVDDRWVPLDATRRDTGTNAVYLKMLDSNLAQQSPYSVVSPIVNAMDRIQIEVVAALPAPPE